jgi:co-chaperonin GroES (HSP10)
MESKIMPLGARVTLKVAATPSKVGSLWVPPEAQDSTYGVCQAEIVAVGDGVRDQRLQPGLRVITRRFGGFPHDEDRTTWSVFEWDVIAIVDESQL